MELQTDNLGKVSVTIEKDYWDINKDYDKLTIVQVQNKYKTYISRKPVPAGAVLTDREYWIPFSSLKEDIILDYNAFTDKYGKEIGVIKDHIKEIDEKLNNFAQNFILHEKGKPNGLASLNELGKIPSEQLPSYVDDVLEYDTFDNIPEEGERGKIYVTNDTDKVYRWSGSKYIEVSPTEGIISLGTFQNITDVYNYCLKPEIINSNVVLFSYTTNVYGGGLMVQTTTGNKNYINQKFINNGEITIRTVNKYGETIKDITNTAPHTISYDKNTNRIKLSDYQNTLISSCSLPTLSENQDGIVSKNYYTSIMQIPILIKLFEHGDIFIVKQGEKLVSTNIPIILNGYSTNINIFLYPTITNYMPFFGPLGTGGFTFKISAEIVNRNYITYNSSIQGMPITVILYENNNKSGNLPAIINVNISKALQLTSVDNIYDIKFILELTGTRNKTYTLKLKSNTYNIIRSDYPIPTSINLRQYSTNFNVSNKFMLIEDKNSIIHNGQPFNNIDYIRKQATLYLGKYENGKMKLSPISDEDKRILKSGISIEKYLTETNKKDYDVWLKLPTFFYKCESINDEQNGIHWTNKLTICSDDSYISEEDEKNWNKWDGNTLIGVYKASLVNNNLHSLPNEIPVTDKSQKQFKELSRSRGNGFRLITYDVHKILALLFFTTSSNEVFDSYGYDSQAICGRGTKNEINNVWYPKKTGLCDYLGKTDTNAINGTGDENPTSENIMKGYGDGIKSVNFLGLENIYGDINEFMDDIYVMSTRDTSSATYNKYILSDFALNNYYPTVTYINAEHTLTQNELEAFNDNRPFIGIFKKDGNLLDRVIDLGDVNFLNDSAREGGIKKLLYGNHADVIPMEVDDFGSISGYNDYFAAYNTGYPFIRSNSSNYGEGGMTCLIAGVDENYHSSECGTRLIYEGTDETIEFTDDI